MANDVINQACATEANARNDKAGALPDGKHKPAPGGRAEEGGAAHQLRCILLDVTSSFGASCVAFKANL